MAVLYVAEQADNVEPGSTHPLFDPVEVNKRPGRAGPVTRVEGTLVQTPAGQSVRVTEVLGDVTDQDIHALLVAAL